MVKRQYFGFVVSFGWGSSDVIDAFVWGRKISDCLEMEVCCLLGSA